MTVYHWILASGVAIFLIAAIRIFYTGLMKSGAPDPSAARGNESSGILYSYTAGMSPMKKESAFLHLPTYAAGMIFHIGTFLSFAWLIIWYFNIILPSFESYILVCLLSSAYLFLSVLCGIGILLKRILKKELRQMSNPDDYISNILVILFQLISALTLLFYIQADVLFITATVLFLYMPLGKLRHSVYFFMARYHLGKYFGKRGVWPAK